MPMHRLLTLLDSIRNSSLCAQTWCGTTQCCAMAVTAFRVGLRELWTVMAESSTGTSQINALFVPPGYC